MKHTYRRLRPLLVLFLLFNGLNAGAQQIWGPFRPGLIYSYALQNGTDATHTLRVDSAYQTAGGDSVYTFNRLMRQSVGTPVAGGYAKSRNNLFGARLRWTPGQGFYVFEADAQPNVQAASSLRIYPRVAVGQSWVASTVPLLTATVQARSFLAVLPGVPDSVVTIELRAGTATTGASLVAFTLSRSYGLVAATPWLGGAHAGTTASAPLLAALPVAVAQSPYNPLALFAMRAGDELGYVFEPFNYFNPPVCLRRYTLRRILTRQERADSLIISYQQQIQQQNLGGTGCGTAAGISTEPVQTGRMAFSTLTGRSPQFPALGLLSGEYRPDPLFTAPQAYLVGGGLRDNSLGNCFSSGTWLPYQRVYQRPDSGPDVTYAPGLDALAWNQYLGPAAGMGDVRTRQTELVYYRRGAGTPLVCGSPVGFATLLPVRVAPAIAVASLFPNPAAETVTLKLNAPSARSGARVELLDALGRRLWATALRPGQQAVLVPLAGQPVGVYVVRLQDAAGATATFRLNKQ
ncbi:T9SS type A sorting domain-containing protein [Hymenobacter sp. IS2118]|uniref:T9SS type A sorting domain-containing protein n=1 Tax=Hymenobacter sp. IS2118 TaxID=1505605 RepID=UPI00055539BA|nr:T9SS type A sorting domain-containing protein [Hymenobacter sp. IS2118]